MKIIDKKGFTLVELIIVIALIAILASIAVLSYTNILDQAAIATDTSNLRLLNTTTHIYRISEDIITEDVFSGISTDEARMQTLVNEGYLTDIIETQKKDTTFYWYTETQKWLYSLYELSGSSMHSYFFSDLLVKDYLHNGTWYQSEDGFASKYGLLFIDNNNDEYTITTTAQLSEGTSGGYGILFETSLIDENHDSGYVLQFDRGYNGIIIRPRSNGSEDNPVLIVKNEDCSCIPNDKSDTWWTQEHQVRLQVSNSETNDGNKVLDVWIGDDQIINDWGFESNTESENNFTGFRSWGVTTTYKQMDVE